MALSSKICYPVPTDIPKKEKQRKKNSVQIVAKMVTTTPKQQKNLIKLIWPENVETAFWLLEYCIQPFLIASFFNSNWKVKLNPEDMFKYLVGFAHRETLPRKKEKPQKNHRDEEI